MDEIKFRRQVCLVNDFFLLTIVLNENCCDRRKFFLGNGKKLSVI